MDYLTRRISGASKTRVEKVFSARLIMNYVITSALKQLSTFCFFVPRGSRSSVLAAEINGNLRR